MTNFRYRLTVAVPEAAIAIANHLAVAIGEGAGDFYTFENAHWQDHDGNRYAVASLQCTATLFRMAGEPLPRRDFAPEQWDAAKAAQAQSMIVLWFGEGDAPLANPTQIAGIVTDDPQYAIQILGLTRIEE